MRYTEKDKQQDAALNAIREAINTAVKAGCSFEIIKVVVADQTLGIKYLGGGDVDKMLAEEKRIDDEIRAKYPGKGKGETVMSRNRRIFLTFATFAYRLGYLTFAVLIPLWLFIRAGSYWGVSEAEGWRTIGAYILGVGLTVLVVGTITRPIDPYIQRFLGFEEKTP